MKIKELIKKLKQFDENQMVFVGDSFTSSKDVDILRVEQEANKEVIIIVET